MARNRVRPAHGEIKKGEVEKRRKKGRRGVKKAKTSGKEVILILMMMTQFSTMTFWLLARCSMCRSKARKRVKFI